MKAEFISVFLHHYSYCDFPRKYLFWALNVNVNKCHGKEVGMGGNIVSNFCKTSTHPVKVRKTYRKRQKGTTKYILF